MGVGFTLWFQFSDESKKSHFFSVCSAFFSCFKNGSFDFQALYMSELKPVLNVISYA